MMKLKDFFMSLADVPVKKDEKGEYWEFIFYKGNIIVKERANILSEIAEYYEPKDDEGEFIYSRIGGIADIICNKEGLEKLKDVAVVYVDENEEYFCADLEEKQIGEDKYLIEDAQLTYFISNVEKYKNDYIPCDNVEVMQISSIYKG